MHSLLRASRCSRPDVIPGNERHLTLSSEATAESSRAGARTSAGAGPTSRPCHLRATSTATAAWTFWRVMERGSDGFPGQRRRRLAGFFGHWYRVGWFQRDYSRQPTSKATEQAAFWPAMRRAGSSLPGSGRRVAHSIAGRAGMERLNKVFTPGDFSGAASPTFWPEVRTEGSMPTIPMARVAGLPHGYCMEITRPVGTWVPSVVSTCGSSTTTSSM